MRECFGAPETRVLFSKSFLFFRNLRFCEMNFQSLVKPKAKSKKCKHFKLIIDEGKNFAYSLTNHFRLWIRIITNTRSKLKAFEILQLIQ